jgi:hypothetical protein
VGAAGIAAAIGLVSTRYRRRGTAAVPNAEQTAIETTASDGPVRRWAAGVPPADRMTHSPARQRPSARASLPARMRWTRCWGPTRSRPTCPGEPGSDTGQVTVDRSFTKLLGGTIVVGPDFTRNVEGGGFASPLRAQRRSAAPGRHRVAGRRVGRRSPSCGRRIQEFRRAETGAANQPITVRVRSCWHVRFPMPARRIGRDYFYAAGRGFESYRGRSV